MLAHAHNLLETFPRSFQFAKLVTDLLATWQTTLICQDSLLCHYQVCDKLAIKWNWETTRHNRLTGANLLRTCYGEAGVMDFGL